MRILPCLSVLLGLVHFSFIGLSQENPCGTETMYQQAITANPDLSHNRDALDEFTQGFVPFQGDTGASYVIPVVFHIMHNYGPENIPRSQILDALEILNTDMRGHNSDTTDVISAFKPIIADSDIEFRLARIDPFGNCTSGITRTPTPLTFGAGENVKALVSWDTDKYLNVWVVASIGIGAAGYAFYPGTAPSPSQEGIVMYVERTGYSLGGIPYRTLTHEVGHYLNLNHVWGNNNDVNMASSCGTDDQVSDTPLTIGTPQNCNLARNTCGSLDNVQNYMDYSACRRMYTNGQKNRMHAALNTSIGGRNNLWTQANLLATGTNDGYVAQCAPIADFIASSEFICVDELVTLNDLSYNDTVDSSWTWTWNLPGSNSVVSNVQNPIVSYPNPGTYEVSLTVHNATGGSYISKTNYITVRGLSGITAPFYEGIEYTLFPKHPWAPSMDWSISPTHGYSWKRTTAASFTGTASLTANALGVPFGTVYTFISPPIDLSQLSSTEATLSFWIAYAQRDLSSSDQFRLFLSNDCGKTWTPRLLKSGQTLNTASSLVNNGPFIPQDWEWRRESPYIGNYAGQTIHLKFELTTGSGNTFYLDNINIGKADSTDTVIVGQTQLDIEQELTLQAFPNPANADAQIVVNGSKSGLVSIGITDLSGRLLASRQIFANQGKTVFALKDLFPHPAAGVYLLSAQQEGLQKTIKLVVNER